MQLFQEVTNISMLPGINNKPDRKHIIKTFFIITFLVLINVLFVLVDNSVYPHFRRQILGDPNPPYSIDTVFLYRYIQLLPPSSPTRNQPHQPPGYILRQFFNQKDGLSKFVTKEIYGSRNYDDSRLQNLSYVPPNPYILPSSLSEEGRFFYNQGNKLHNSRLGSSTKFIAFYNKPSWLEQQIVFEDCQISDCRMVGTLATHKANAVVFSAPDLHQDQPPSRPPTQRWVYFNMESPENTNSSTTAPIWSGQFNLTMTYRTDSDIFLPYAYFKERKDWPRKDYGSIARRKSRLAAIFVSNCQSPSLRLKYIQELQNYMPVDVYGKCGPYKCYSRHHKDCLDILDAHYKFYLSFENSLCMDYVTEKLTKIFRDVDVVPVVRGGADYDKILPPGTYINAAWFVTPKELADHIKGLDKDTAGYIELLREKDRYVEVDPLPVSRAFCDLCDRLHNEGDGDVQYYTNVANWFGQIN